jgi:hypothetical protein
VKITPILKRACAAIGVISRFALNALCEPQQDIAARNVSRSTKKNFDTATWVDYTLAVGIALILTFIGSLFASRIGFFTIFLAPIAGIVIAEAIRLVIRRRRSKRLFQATAAATAFGGMLPVLSVLALTGLSISFSGLFFFIWPIVYTVLVTSTVYYRLAGIRL